MGDGVGGGVLLERGLSNFAYLKITWVNKCIPDFMTLTLLQGHRHVRNINCKLWYCMVAPYIKKIMHCVIATYIKNTMRNNLCGPGVYLREMMNTFWSGFALECELSESICSFSLFFLFFPFFFFGSGGRRGREGLGLIDLKLIYLHVPDIASLCVSVSRMFDIVKR